MRIVIGTDGSTVANVACEFVATRAWPFGTRVRLLSAVEPRVDWSGGAVGAGAADGARSDVELVLEEQAGELRRVGLSVETAVRIGPAGQMLMTEAAETFADLIVVGSRGRGPVASAVLGSVSTQLVDHAGCPVLVARSAAATRMLVATDGTEGSRTIPRVLAAWGNAFRGLPTEVLSVAPREAFVTPWAGEDDDADVTLHEGIAARVAAEMEQLGWAAAPATRVGDPSRLIVDEGREWGADLIVTGSRGIGTLRRLMMGSVAHDVLLHARSSVLVVRGQVPARLAERAVFALN